ncbi:asparagine synthetase B family protein [Rhodocaloribacter sp.]
MTRIEGKNVRAFDAGVRPPLMRVVGIHAPGREAWVERFRAWAEAQPALTVAAFPSEEPFVAMAVRKDAADLHVATAADGSFACVDGEVYNLAELRARAGLAEGGVADVVLALWRKEGTAGLGRIVGQASLTLWEAPRGRAALVRDRAGVPPVFFAEHEGALLWASDLQTLLVLGVERALDPLALDAYLSLGYVPAPWTFIEGIRKIPPAHALVREAGATTLTPYWAPALQPKHKAPKARTVAELRKHVEESLRRATETGGPFGVLLSGGVDSSLVVAGLHRWLGVPVTAFTYEYEAYEGKWNEYERARKLTEHLGVPHEKITMGPAWVAEHLPALLARHEEPFTYGIHTARLDAVRAAGIPTVLTGALPGFPGQWELARTETLGLRLGAWPGLPWQTVARLTKPLAGRGPLDRLHAVARLAAGSAAELYEGKAVNTIVRDEERLRLYRDPERFRAGRAARLGLMERILADSGAVDRFDRHALLTSRLLQAEHNLWWNHRWGRAHDLRFRFPFLDPGLTRFLARLRRADASKTLFREVAATVMPREIAFFPKLGQAAPLWQWLRLPPLRDLVTDTLTPARIEDAGLFRTDVITRAVGEHVRGERAHQWLVWTMLSFFLWKEVVLDAPPGAKSGIPRILDA